MIPQLSPPGWTLLVIAALTIIMQTPNIYNPSAFMAEFGISDKPVAQLIAFLLVLINGYDLLGASQDSWTVYWYSLVSRAVAMVFFWLLGEPWSKLVRFEGATFAILGIAMWFG